MIAILSRHDPFRVLGGTRALGEVHFVRGTDSLSVRQARGSNHERGYYYEPDRQIRSERGHYHEPDTRLNRNYVNLPWRSALFRCLLDCGLFQ